jgi:hypothetical protein
MVERRVMFPTRWVLEQASSRDEYRTSLESVLTDGNPAFFHVRIFDTEEDAVQDFERRVQRL